ncbi:MAG: COX15/CtaA family protein [Flavobacteriales bacterium]
MKKSPTILLLSKITLVLVFMVIIAGSVVRMSGSGMGCPDWPKCFGYYIPPTDIETLTFSEGKVFEKGKMVLLNDTLWVATKDVQAGPVFNRSDWEKYARHDYAYYNPVHTWTEYINRLVGATAGIPTFLLFVFSFLHLIKRKDIRTFIFASTTLFMLGFEAWLGKTVVDAELLPFKITLHMLGSIVIVALLIYLIKNHEEKALKQKSFSTYWKVLSIIWVLIAGSQILLGTQVREAVDIVSNNIDDRWQWIDNLPSVFKFHRSFSLVIVALLAWTYARSKGLLEVPKALKGIMIVAVIEIVVGIVLAYAGVPAFAQPIHLFFAIMWFAFTFSFMLTVWRKSTTS